jgi:acyl dehydratase
MEEKMKYFDDFDMGEKIVTKGRTITEADIVLFAAFSGDWHQLHTNVEFAKNGPFGERIAHGFLVLSVASGLMGLEGMAIMAFYGMDNLRFVGPTRIGDTIHLEMEVAEKKEKDEKSGVVSLKITVKNQKESVMAVFIMKLLIEKNEQH